MISPTPAADASSRESRLERSLYAIAPTQFDRNGAVSLPAMKENMLALIEHGISDVLLAGAYGEFQTLDDDERYGIVAAIASGPARRIMACAAHPSTVATAELGTRLLDAGANEIMISPPLLAEVSDADVIRHFEELSKRIDAPLVIYNNPIFGIDLRSDQMQSIANLQGFVAIKQGSKDHHGIRVAMEAVGTSLRVLGASDLSCVDALTAGAHGFTSTNSWIFPSAFTLIARYAGTAQHRIAGEVRKALDPYMGIVRELGQPRTVKAAMQLRGYSGTSLVRLPHVELDEEEMRRLQAAIERSDQLLAEVNPGETDR